MIALRASQTLPRPPWKLSVKFPARAIETGNQAAAPISEATDTSRRVVRRALSPTAEPAAAQRPIAVSALPTGRPPGNMVSRYAAPETSDSTANAATAKSSATTIVGTSLRCWYSKPCRAGRADISRRQRSKTHSSRPASAESACDNPCTRRNRRKRWWASPRMKRPHSLDRL